MSTLAKLTAMWLLLLGLVAPPTALAADRVALVIGNAEYKHAPRLLNPGNDARDVAEALGRLGFDVTKKTDLDGLGLRSALRDFQRVANTAEIAVVYYSGHGIGVDGQSWLAPIDAQLANQEAVEFETISLDLVLASVRGARQLRLVVLDACRDNPFIASMAPRPGGGRSINRGLAPVAPPRNDTLVWYAAKDGSTASDGRGRNSPFTEAFLEHVEIPGLELGRLFRQMTAGVQERTSGAQTPWSYGTRGPVDFFLAGAADPKPPAKPVPALAAGADLAAKQAFETANATGDPALLDVVAARFAGSVWGDLAAARAATLRGEAITAAAALADAEAKSDAAATRDEAAEAVEIAAQQQEDAEGQLYRGGQTELKRLGLYQGPVDGDWGSGSRRAMRAAQRALGLSEDGEITLASLERLRAASIEEVRPTAAIRSAGERFRDCPACPEMVVIPGGSFQMGSNDGDSDEKPVHSVRVQSFAMGVYEVTFDEWEACVADGYCTSNQTPDDKELGRGSRPVINVSWDDITGRRGFVDWLNSKVDGAPFRLPSEAEWEYATRAGSQTKYSFGDSASSLSRFAWFSDNSGGKTHPVGGKQPNSFGLHDMHGNAWEWVQDCWNNSYSGAPSDGSPWMSGFCSIAVLRGGSWYNNAEYLRSAFRLRALRGYRDSNDGFRVSRTLVD